MRISKLIWLNVVALLGLSALVSSGEMSLYGVVLLGWAVMSPVNMLLGWNVYKQARNPVHQSHNPEQKIKPVATFLWVIAGVFTIAGIVAVLICIHEPTLPHRIQMGVAIVLVTYIWFLIHRLRSLKT